MSKKLKFFAFLLVIVALVVAALPTTAPQAKVAQAQDPVKVTWFVGLGTGGQPEQLAAQEAVVADFNSTVGAEKGIELVLVVVDNNVANDTLSTLLSSPDEAPDIVGPVGTRGSNGFSGNWADLEPLAEAAGYDLTQFPQAQVDFYRVEGEGLIGLPFGVYPSFIYFNRDIFDAAGLPYPPQSFGEPYADGDEWNFDKLEEISLELTLDANGNNANSPDFDADNIVQFGYFNQWTDPRGAATSFGAANFVDSDGVTAIIPENWAAYYNWYYDAMWESHFIPNAAYAGSELLNNGNTLPSGNVAMAYTHLWYVGSAGEGNWDIAVTPSYDGVYTAKLHDDTFRILKQSQNPDAAFEVLTYLIGEGSIPLLQVYGSLPARPENQGDFFAALDETYTQGVNWQVAIDSLNFPDNPSHEANMPNFLKADDRIKSFGSLIDSTPGLDIDAELATLQSDLQAIFDEVAE